MIEKHSVVHILNNILALATNTSNIAAIFVAPYKDYLDSVYKVTREANCSICNSEKSFFFCNVKWKKLGLLRAITAC
mgnify:CR=1 FL=1